MLSSIGEGAFGEVSLAACTIFGRVAVKWLKVRLRQLHGVLSVPGTPHLLHLGCTQAAGYSITLYGSQLHTQQGHCGVQHECKGARQPCLS